MNVTALTRNGNAPLTGSNVMRLGDTVPKTVTIELNGRPLKGSLISSRRFSSSTAAELDDARNEYLDKRIAVLPDGSRPSLSLYQAGKALAALFPDEGEPPTADALKEAVAKIKTAVTETEQARYRSSQRDWETYVTRCLMALVDGLEAHEADMLGPDRLRILVRLGHLDPTQLPDETLRTMVEEGELDPEVAARVMAPMPAATEDAAAAKEAAPSTRPPGQSKTRSTGARPARGSQKATT